MNIFSCVKYHVSCAATYTSIQYLQEKMIAQAIQIHLSLKYSIAIARGCTYCDNPVLVIA